MIRVTTITAAVALCASTATRVYAAGTVSEPAAPSAAGEDREIDQDEVVVTARRATGDVANAKSSLTGLPVSNLDLPKSVNIVTSETIDRQQPVNFTELLRNVSSIGHTANGDVSVGVSFTTVRGLPVSDFYVDGIRNQYFGQVSTAFIQTVENVEVIEGPAGVLTGGNNLGGTINIVFKKPSFTPRYFAQAGIGFTGSTDAPIYNGAFDATGPINDTFAYRVIVSGQSLETIAKGTPAASTYSIAPSLTARLGGRGTATLALDYARQNLQYSDIAGYPAFGTLLPNASGLRFSNEDPFVTQGAHLINHTYDARLNVDYDVADHLKLVANAQYSYLYWRQYQGILFALADPVAQNKESIGQSVGSFPSYYTSGGLKLVSDSNVFGASNLFVVGGEYYRRIAKTQDSQLGPNVTVTLPYVAAPLNFAALPFAPARDNRDLLQQTSFFAQDQLTPVSWLNLTAGLRHDHVTDVTTSLGGRFPLKRDKVTYNLAAAVKPTPDTNIYVQYGTGFAPPSPASLSFTGATFKPEEGSVLEGGVKAKVGRFYVRAAAFRTIRENVLTPDPVNFGFSVATGKVRVKGFELSADGRLAPGLTVNGSYTHLASRILEDNTTVNNVRFANVGRRFPNIAADTARLFLHYDFASGSALHGLGMGAGVTYSSSVDVVNNVTAASVIPLVPNTLGTGTVPNPLIRNLALPAYALIDAHASYTLGRYKVQMNATNLANKRYYPNGRNTGRIYIGRPRQLLLTLGAAF